LFLGASVRVMIGSLVLAVCVVSASGQRPGDIVKWTAHLRSQTAAAATVDLVADIQLGWHVYALSQPRGGPTPLVVSIPESEAFALNGPVHEPTPVRHFDSSFKMETVFYLNHVQLVASINKVKVGPAISIPVNVRFQACNGNLCLPPQTVHLSAEP